ncbi:hypothetical protein ACSQ67_013247 [Phaseolus vulgaris]
MISTILLHNNNSKVSPLTCKTKQNKTRDSTVHHNLRCMHFLLAAFSYSFSYSGCSIPSEMHFHHCFLQASDASVLIAGAATQITAFANLSLKGSIPGY